MLSGCAVSTVSGAINTARWGGGVSNPEVRSVRSGEACAGSVLGLFASGDASIEAFTRAAGMTRVATVDHRTMTILYCCGGRCTVVYGE